MSARVAAATLLLATLAAEGARAESVCVRGPARDWRDGPVRYLISEDEWSRFGRLETDAARVAFVERFWKRLDAGSGMDEGGFQERFERRCFDAEARFARDDPPGWRSDRGRVLLLLGDPASIENLPGEAESIGREIWVYPYAAGQRTTTLRIPFYRRLDGRIRLEPPRPATSVGTPVVFDAIRGRARSLTRATWFPRGTGFGARVDGILSRSAIEYLPRPPEVVPTRPDAEAREAAEGSASGLRDGAWFFQAADGSVLTLVAVSVAPDAGLDPATTRGSAFVTDAGETDRGDAVERIPLERARDSTQGGNLHLGRAYLEPSASVRLRFALTDAARETMLVRSRTIEVPELGTGGFSVSSVVPAESFGPLPEGVASPFAAGSEIVIPRPSATFARGETLRLYLQVYGAALDPVLARPRIDVTFRFFRDNGRRFVSHQPPLRLREAFGASLGLSLPIGDWPTGAYRVDVDLRDRVANRLVRAESAFHVTE